jgi:hypothetical protein
MHRIHLEREGGAAGEVSSTCMYGTQKGEQRRVLVEHMTHKRRGRRKNKTKRKRRRKRRRRRRRRQGRRNDGARNSFFIFVSKRL